MAGIAAVLDLLINRIVVLLGSDVWSPDQLVALGSWGSFARNLSVVSALVALGFCLAELSSPKSGLPAAARGGIASFGWVLIPIVTLMTFLPRTWTRPELVLVVAGLAHAVILIVILAGIQPRAGRALTVAMVLTLISAFSGILSTVVTLTGERAYWEHTDRLANAFRWSGELAYLLVPIAVGLSGTLSWRGARGKITVLLSAAAAAAVAAGLALWKHAVGRDLPDLLYGAIRLDFLPDDDFVLYAIPLAIGAGVTTAATMSKDPARRQLGAALLCLLSAGYAPRSPSTMLLTVLGASLLARSAIGIARRAER